MAKHLIESLPTDVQTTTAFEVMTELQLALVGGGIGNCELG